MLNHTYTSVKNANLVDCGKKQHIPSQPTPLLKENFLGEFRTELDKKKVLAALGIATELSLEWGNIKGDVGDNLALMQELDARTKYTSSLDNMQKTIGEGIAYLETIVGNDKTKDNEQDQAIETLISTLTSLKETVSDLSDVLSTTTDSIIPGLSTRIDAIDESINNITTLVTVSEKTDNALQLLTEEGVEGLYVQDLDPRVSAIEQNVSTVEEKVVAIEGSLDSFVTKDDLGGDGTYDFVDQQTYNAHVQSVASEISTIKGDLSNTVKTGEDGHVDTLFVNKISKDNEGNIEVTDSFEVTTDKPLDVRFVRKTVDDLLALPVSVCYEGMGVIVSSLNSLYILKHTEGALTQEYISDINNWKCPEDLVTVAMTQTDYDNLEEKNPNVFYYIYEKEFTLTKPPRREEYETDEDFENAKIAWEEQVKALDQQYVSASWGVEIEELLSKKASNESVNLLKQEINAIKGDGEGPSLGNLGNSILELQGKSESLETSININSEKLDSIKTNVEGIEKSLVDYVTKEELQDETQEFIFVKTSTYKSDKDAFLEQLATKVETKEIVTENLVTTNLNTDNLNLNNVEIKVVDDHLSVGDDLVAMSEDLLKVEILTQSDYDDKESKGELDEEVYYYTYDNENPTATKEDLQKALDRISTLETNLMLLTKQVLNLEEQIKSLTPSE